MSTSHIPWPGMIPGHLLADGRHRLAEKAVGLSQSQPLQEQQRDEAEGSMMVQATPRPALEMIQPDLLLQFPVSQFTRPALLSDPNQMQQ